MADRITYVGLDVHKESIVAAVAPGGLRGEVREYGLSFVKDIASGFTR